MQGSEIGQKKKKIETNEREEINSKSGFVCSYYGGTYISELIWDQFLIFSEFSASAFSFDFHDEHNKRLCFGDTNVS